MIINVLLIYYNSYFLSNKGSLKRKSDAVDLSNINRSSQKGVAFNFASSTPTLGSVNQQPMVLYSSKYSLR